jgi:hypothetical protein
MPIVNIPSNNVITTDGEYAPTKGHSPGRPVSIEVTGEIGGATIVFGFVSSDPTPVFVNDYCGWFYSHGNHDPEELLLTTTLPRRIMSSRPASGKPALKITGAGVNTAIRVRIVDMLPR